eukprot:jgi/Psemu1/249692/estExt_Genewise1Plus.C_70067
MTSTDGSFSITPALPSFLFMLADDIGWADFTTTNCQCKAEWLDSCNFGHYNKSEHCFNGDCCFNYWWDDPLAPHGVTNLTWPTPPDDSLYLADAFSRYLKERSAERKPFLAQISFHNCHIPFIGSKEAKESCARGETCRSPRSDEKPFTDEELDYYACLVELDNAVGMILKSLKKHSYYDNTMTWFATDNGPEMNCPPNGICQRAKTAPQRPIEGPGSAGPLRGRKRDIYEGGHRVPGIVSYPAEMKNGNAISWETVTTMDFLPTIMEALSVDRPNEQQSWAFDGRSILSLLRNATTFKWEDTDEGPRSIGYQFHDPYLDVGSGWGYRFGRWKYVEGSVSCSVSDCKKPQLFDIEADIGERHDLSSEYPDILADLQLKFRDWHNSIMKSRREESKCRKTGELTMPQSLMSATE